MHNKNKLIGIIVVTFCFLLISFGRNFAQTLSKSLEIKCEVTVKNISLKTINNLIIKVPVFTDDPQRQSTEILEITPKPLRIEKDKLGNLYVVFGNLSILPSQNILLKIKSNVITQDKVWFFDSSQTDNCIFSNDEFLKGNKNIQSDNLVIKVIANIITQNQKKPLYISSTLYNYIYENIDLQIHPNSKTAIHVLFRKKAQCLDSNYLYCALLRACNVPARVSLGILNIDGEEICEDFHAWTEVFIPPMGWVSVDPVFSKSGLFSRYLNFAQISENHILIGKNLDSFIKCDDNDSLAFNFIFRIKQIPTKNETKSDFSFNFPERSADLLGKKGNIDPQLKGQILSELKIISNFYHRKKLFTLIENYKKVNSSLNDFYKGICFLYLKNWEEAEICLQKSLEAGFKNGFAYNALGFLYLETKQYEKADLYLWSAQRIMPDYLPIYENLLIKNNVYNVKIPDNLIIGMGRKYFPDDPVLYGYEALYFYKRGIYDKADKAVKYALKKSPNDLWLKEINDLIKKSIK